MPRFRVDPRAVTKVQMKDGTVYRPDAHGYVRVSHRHEDEMSKSPAAHLRTGHDLDYLTLSFPGGSGRTCPTCAFVGWAWQRVCPRDGAALVA